MEYTHETRKKRKTFVLQDLKGSTPYDPESQRRKKKKRTLTHFARITKQQDPARTKNKQIVYLRLKIEIESARKMVT